MPRGAGVTSRPPKPVRSNTDRKAGISPPTFLSLGSLKQKSIISSVPDQPPPVQELPRQQHGTADILTTKLDLPVDSALVRVDSKCDGPQDADSSSPPNEPEHSVRPESSRTSSGQSIGEEDTYEAALNTLGDLTIDEETQSSASSSYYGDSSSIYSSAASIYSIDECGLEELDADTRNGSAELTVEETKINLDARSVGILQYQQRARPVAVRRPEPQDEASRERSSLARKAALFKNSRLPPQLQSFNTSLRVWSMVCRAVQASQDCYESRALTRRGIYTAADTAKDIKAMIVDDQVIEDSRIIIVSVRGTECRSLADWAVNKAANPAKPIGFLDDEENACHAGFLQVTKAMVGQVAAQLQCHPATAERPSLLFTGHSAGGAVAAMLYSHMLSISLQSDLTALANQFSSINCVTFGAPPLSLTPLPERDHGSGVFLAFANEGDPVLRLCNAAYVKSLAKLMTASTSAAPAAPVKVVRRSRGSAVVYRPAAVPPTPWEELPLWPTPPPPLANAGNVILLRDNKEGSATASRVTSEDLREVIFGDLAQHTIQMYMRRVEEIALAAMTGRIAN